MFSHNVKSLYVTFSTLKHKFSFSRFYSNRFRLDTSKEVKSSGGIQIVNTRKDAVLDIIRACRSARGRNENKMFLIEDRPYIMEALAAGVQLETICIGESAFSQQNILKESGSSQYYEDLTIGIIPLEKFNQQHIPLTIIPDAFLKNQYPVETPAMFAIAKKLHLNYESIDSFKHMNRILVLDNVLNPRNLGMIMRNAAAFGIDGVVLISTKTPEKRKKKSKAKRPQNETTGENKQLLEESNNQIISKFEQTHSQHNPLNLQDIMYSRLSVSTSRGALFHIPFIHISTIDELVKFSQDHKFDLICTAPFETALEFGLPIYEPKKSNLKSTKKKKKHLSAVSDIEVTSVTPKDNPKKIIVIGNESLGVNPEIIAKSNAILTIPTQVESLNVAVACGIVLFNLLNKDILNTPIKQL